MRLYQYLTHTKKTRQAFLIRAATSQFAMVVRMRQVLVKQ